MTGIEGITVSVNEESVARAPAAVSEAGRQLAESIGRLEGYAVELWIIDTPEGKQACYVDDANQKHWVLLGFTPVDPSWRRLYVEKRA